MAPRVEENFCYNSELDPPVALISSFYEFCLLLPAYQFNRIQVHCSFSEFILFNFQIKNLDPISLGGKRQSSSTHHESATPHRYATNFSITPPGRYADPGDLKENMEGVRSRSESPFARGKTKTHLSNTTENGSRVIEQMKHKKKSQRTKNKQQLNGKEIEDPDSNGQDFGDEEKVTSNEIDNNVDINNGEDENEINTENDIENGTNYESKHEGDSSEIDVTTTVTEISKEVKIAPAHDNLNEGGIAEESESVEEYINVDEINPEECCNTTETETESSAKKEVLILHGSLPKDEILSESYEGKCGQNSNEIGIAETNGLTQDEEPNKEQSSVQEVCQIDLNGSDDSLHCKEGNIKADHTQVSPDTVTKDGISISSKITNFLGKFAYSPEQKQDSEITSSKKLERISLNHPYLSKVSGRRGIKERLNSSATVFSSTEKEPKTPENVGVSLDDSFRVHTNPPRLSSVDLDENPTLRKFKGKRCLNAGDEPEEEENAYISTMKRRKLDDRTQDSGILGSILWSPFKKRSMESENQVKLTTESKLSRLLGPFWFWKKATEGQKRK